MRFMAMAKVYIYERCSTCRKARQWLEANEIPYETASIRETPPDEEELERALASAGGNLRKIVNTSSPDYRKAGLRDQLDQMSREEVFALLRKQGNLIKRPFLVTGNTACAGFDLGVWKNALT